jgi:trk system potassium uptake protein TrkH
MTLSSSLLARLRRKITLGQAAAIQEALGPLDGTDLFGLLRRCARTVAAVELVGAALLFMRFSFYVPAGESWPTHAPRAAWEAIFHSVSAFCNCGLCLWDDSLARYANDWMVNVIIGLLVVLGGLGFFVLRDVEDWLASLRRKERRKLRFQTHVVLWTSFGLILVGAGLIWMGE